LNKNLERETAVENERTVKNRDYYYSIEKKKKLLSDNNKKKNG